MSSSSISPTSTATSSLIYLDTASLRSPLLTVTSPNASQSFSTGDIINVRWTLSDPALLRNTAVSLSWFYRLDSNPNQLWKGSNIALSIAASAASYSVRASSDLLTANYSIGVDFGSIFGGNGDVTIGMSNEVSGAPVLKTNINLISIRKQFRIRHIPDRIVPPSPQTVAFKAPVTLVVSRTADLTLPPAPTASSSTDVSNTPNTPNTQPPAIPGPSAPQGPSTGALTAIIISASLFLLLGIAATAVLLLRRRRRQQPSKPPFPSTPVLPAFTSLSLPRTPSTSTLIVPPSPTKPAPALLFDILSPHDAIARARPDEKGPGLFDSIPDTSEPSDLSEPGELGDDAVVAVAVAAEAEPFEDVADVKKGVAAAPAPPPPADKHAEARADEVAAVPPARLLPAYEAAGDEAPPTAGDETPMRWWTAAQVGERLMGLGVGPGLAAALEDHGVDGVSLETITAEALVGMGIAEPFSRHVVLQAVEYLRSGVVPAASASASAASSAS
ncbi:hypothetical protein HDU96_010572 [Phlyctochytrium bullatum]|nr:hypothetical protein HDU96_010572 [Phlyctochytrium bullatum]